MKNLWTVMPPLLSDNFGFIEVLKGSDGCGIIDDSGGYRLSGGHGGHGGHEERHRGEHRGEFHRGGHPGKGKHGGKGDETRTVVSGAGEQDVTAGTREKLLEAFEEAKNRFAPNFALFSAGPCGAMIGTDLSEIAETVSREHGIPAASVELSGQKTYDVGISKTTEAMAWLLAEEQDVRPGTVNILGATSLDWSDEDLSGVKTWAEKQGFQVLSQPGGTVTAQQLRQMGAAQLNLVATVSGLAAAKYLQSRFGTPYAAAVPFGGDLGLAAKKETGNADVLIIGEQFAANALRNGLERMGRISDVATFFQLEKAYARPGDRRIRGEDGAKELLNCGKYRVIIADPLLRPLLQRDCKWIDLPHKALSTYGEVTAVSLLGEKLDNWLDLQF